MSDINIFLVKNWTTCSESSILLPNSNLHLALFSKTSKIKRVDGFKHQDKTGMQSLNLFVLQTTRTVWKRYRKIGQRWRLPTLKADFTNSETWQFLHCHSEINPCGKKKTCCSWEIVTTTMTSLLENSLENLIEQVWRCGKMHFHLFLQYSLLS